jgi:hypothetical protein
VKIGNNIDKIIMNHVDEVLKNNELPDTQYIETDNLGEVIEKLVILHIRTWMLEDMIHSAQTDSEVAELKRKIDICFKQKRPKFVEAINLMIDNAILKGKTLNEESVKIYKGV